MAGAWESPKERLDMGGVSQGSDIEWVLRMSRSLPAKNAGMGISGEYMGFRDLRVWRVSSISY